MKNTYSVVGSIVLLIAFVLMHDSLTKNSFKLGFSWTLASMIPYVVQFIAAFLVAIQLQTLVNVKKYVYKRLVFTISLVALCGLAFGINPIYEGDFSNNQQQVTMKSNEGDVFDKGLTMVALPGCPFCFARIPLLNKLKSRNPSLKITVLIVSDSQETYDIYDSELVSTIEIAYSPHGQLIAQTTQGRFPAFFFMDRKGGLVYWNQEGFGTLALDWIEKHH